jgi:uncharacterized membrane protein YdbT with pleckstrin-like domain
MFKLENVVQLKPGERIRFITKRHAVTIIPRLVLSFFFIVIPFFFVFPMFKGGPLGIAAFAVFVLAGIFLAWRTFVMWDGEALVISSERVVRVAQAGIFSRTVIEADLDHVADISWRRHGIMGTLFNFGDLAINTTSQQKVAASKLPNPREIHSLLVEALDTARAKTAASVSEREARITRLRSEIGRLGDAELSALERALERSDRAEAVGDLFRPPQMQAVQISHADAAVRHIPVRQFDPSEASEFEPLEKTEIREIDV